MATERITAAAVSDELEAAIAAERGTHVVRDLGMTRWTIADRAPAEWEAVSAYIHALLAREPARSSAAYVSHRMILGSLATELRTYARDAGEPVGLEVDLRAATSQAEEHRIRERIADHQAALDRHVDDVMLRQQIWRDQEAARAVDEEPPTAAPSTEADDSLAYL